MLRVSSAVSSLIASIRYFVTTMHQTLNMQRRLHHTKRPSQANGPLSKVPANPAGRNATKTQGFRKPTSIIAE